MSFIYILYMCSVVNILKARSIWLDIARTFDHFAQPFSATCLDVIALTRPCRSRDFAQKLQESITYICHHFQDWILALKLFFVPRYDAASLLLVYAVYIVVLCFDLRISEFVLRKLSPCCTCLGRGSNEKRETQPLMGWNDDTSLRVHSRSRTDSGIFQDDSGYSHLSLSLHGLNEIPEGKKTLVIQGHDFTVFSIYDYWWCDTNVVLNMFVYLRPGRA